MWSRCATPAPGDGGGGEAAGENGGGEGSGGESGGNGGGGGGGGEGPRSAQPGGPRRPRGASQAQAVPLARKRRQAEPEDADVESEGDAIDGEEEVGELRAAKRTRVGVGEIAAAAIEQWGLSEAKVLRWAAERGLPGVGIADLEHYRREHPEEDMMAGLSDLLS